MVNPTVFISYSWDSTEHKNWVTALANELRRNGIDAKIDEFITQRGTVNLNRMMIENIRDRDYSLVVLTENYAEKANTFNGGVGYETSLLINEVIENSNKIIPIMKCKKDAKKATPFYLKDITYIDFTNDSNLSEKFEELLYKILNVDRIEMEPLGSIPNLKTRKITMDIFNRNTDDNNELTSDFRISRDKNKFIKASYIEVTDYLLSFAEQVRKKNSNFDYKVDVINNKKFVFKYYINGLGKLNLKIWLSDSFSIEDSICLSYGNYGYAWDEKIVCELNCDKELKLKKMTRSMYVDKRFKDSIVVSLEIWRYILEDLRH